MEQLNLLVVGLELVISTVYGNISINYHISSAKTANTQIHVTGWKQINTGTYGLSVNGHTAQLIIKIDDESTIVKPLFEDFGGYTIPQQYRPKYLITNVAYSNNNIILAVNTEGKISRRGMYSSNIYCGIYGTLFWEY